eukprot:m.493155 g.493155  ORF g.493155 m.493155 type:complete len:129 (+) comp57280_c0_seq28:293-679(+)
MSCESSKANATSREVECAFAKIPTNARKGKDTKSSLTCPPVCRLGAVCSHSDLQNRLKLLDLQDLHFAHIIADQARLCSNTEGRGADENGNGLRSSTSSGNCIQDFNFLCLGNVLLELVDSYTKPQSP